jgi:hypothetical protein
MMSDQHDDADDADDVKPAAPVLSYQTPSQAIDWVSVWTAQNTLEANLAVATLQARGIHARLDMENSAGLGLPYAGVIYAKVQVLAQDAEAARTMLLDIQRQRERRRAATTLACPRCGDRASDRILHPIRYAAWGMFIAFVLVIVLHESLERIPFIGSLLLVLPLAGVAMLVWGVTPRWRCRSCGYRWCAKEPEELEEDEQEKEDDRRDGDEEGDR